MRVHIEQEPEGPARAALLEGLDPRIVVTFGAEPASCDILVAGRPKPEWLQGVRAVVIPFAGVPDATLQLMREHPGVALHNLHHNGPATAEMAVALLLAAAKSLPGVDARFRKGDWSDRGKMEMAVQLAGRNALVLGYGAIGRRVADVCRALGMSVDAVARRSREGVYTLEALPGLLPRADALVICLPATLETEGLIGHEQLALLPRTSVVVNVARGRIIDERALFEALKERRIFAAGLDAWWDYPRSEPEWGNTPPSKQPFHELDYVVLSPHRGGHVANTEIQRMRALAELLNAAARGENVPNRVDLDAGY